MSTPITLKRKVEKRMRRIPAIEEMIILLPDWRRTGSPDEVSTMALPQSTMIKAVPPAMPKIIERSERTKGPPDGSVEKHPKTVQ